MFRFFCKSFCISNNRIIIEDKAEAHHAKDVLRLKENETVIAVDEGGNEYRCVIEKLGEKITLLIKEKVFALDAGQSVNISVACAIPKKAKMDDIIDKLTQLGVARIIPLETERVIIKLDKAKKALRRQRWGKIAHNAAKQSQRRQVPLIEPVAGISEVLARAENFDLKLIPTLMNPRLSLKEVVVKNNPKNILVFIGPEGDFTEKEVALAKKAGCIPVSLGDTVLRVDTAAIAVVGFIKLYYGNN